MDVKFSIPGAPVGKGRPKFARQGGFVRTYTPEKTASYENLVKLEYERQCKSYRFPENAPLKMNITAYYPIPKSASKSKRAAMLNKEIRPTKKPDVDNIVKIIADSLNEVAYKDDSQIVSASISKYYEAIPRVEVAIIDLTV